MPNYSRGARRWIEPLLALSVGGTVTLRFLAPHTDPAGELGILPGGAGTYTDHIAPGSYVREMSAEELATLAGQFRQGAREVLLSDAFAQSVAAGQALPGAKEMFESAAGVVVSGQLCRIRSFKPLDAGDETYGWQLLCDAPLDAA